MAPMTAMRTIIGSIPPRSASRLINLESTSFLNNASLRAACDFFRAAESAFGLGSSSAEPEVGALFFCGIMLRRGPSWLDLNSTRVSRESGVSALLRRGPPGE